MGLSELTYIFISHSRSLVAQLATRIAVMRAGQFVETGSAQEILRRPKNPYTRELLSAVPELPPHLRRFFVDCLVLLSIFNC